MYLAYTLVTYLRKGVPLPVGMFYAGMLALTWVISFFRFQRSTIDRYLVIKRLFYLCVGPDLSLFYHESEQILVS